MTIAIADVPMWLVLERATGHALQMTRSGWHLTACGKFTPNGETKKEIPSRICRACRKKLANATFTSADGQKS